MKILHEMLVEALQEIAESRADLSEAQMDALAQKATEGLVEDLARSVSKTLRKKLPSKLRAERRAEAGFVRRNKERWCASFGELEFMYHVAAEITGELVQEWNAEINDDPYVFGALNHLNVKALVTTKEIICLMQGGYADGALARWRTLHEAAVISTLIRDASSDIAERYLASFDFMALKAARQLNEYADRANLAKFTPEQVSEMDVRCKLHIDRFGEGLENEFGWASSLLKARRPNLLDLERATGLDHWRPRYRWASQSVHGGYRPPGASLAMSEAVEASHAIGPSNSGMVDPIQMTALSLLIVVSNFICRWPNADRLVTATILSEVNDGIATIALEEERKSMERYRAQAAP